MPRRSRKERVNGQFFVWLMGTRKNGVYYADGRSNRIDVGRNSLGTSNYGEARTALIQLDLAMAVKHSLAPRTILDKGLQRMLPLEEGGRLYLEYVGRPEVVGGAGPGTVQRYRAVFDKLFEFSQDQGVRDWDAITKRLLIAYGAWLDEHGYAYATEYLELTTIKQCMNWLAEEGHIPTSSTFHLELEKPRGTFTYCYRREEVTAMLGHCFGSKPLHWLGEVIAALSLTGLRIGELAQLRWTNIELQERTIRISDGSRRGTRADRARAQTTKTRRGRELPIHPQLLEMLAHIKRHSDGRVFHGPQGGVLKPDTVRNILTEQVLKPLAPRFPGSPGDRSFRDGRLHSFRHFFCSVAAAEKIPELLVRSWLGHRDSKIIQRYYHPFRDEAQAQMAQIPVTLPAMATDARLRSADGPVDSTA